ncbi:hypothetical protein [Brotaphodocola sp.]|uniref:hypothetical protein n=1 Tax=Brotaphodocola sp. TaxID=3073577 RepID=UPI003D7EB502
MEKGFAEDVENVDLQTLFLSRIFFWKIWMKETLYNKSRKRGKRKKKKQKNKELTLQRGAKKNERYVF